MTELDCPQVEEELWEQDFIESCFNEMLEEEEQWEWFIPSRDLPLLGHHSAPCLSELQHSSGLHSVNDSCSQTELPTNWTTENILVIRAWSTQF